jgi:hypothetical protein
MGRPWVTWAAVIGAACGGDDGARVDAGVVDAGVDGGADAGEVDAGPTDAGFDSGTCRAPQDASLPPFPDAGPREAPPALDCGTPSFPAGTGLRRYPYVQATTETGARIAWTTTTGGAGSVRFAESLAGPWTEVEATAEMFAMARTEDEPVDFVAYDAALAGLSPNRAYCYEVLEGGVPIATGLRLGTAWRGAVRPVRILAFGDSGSGAAAQMALRDRFMEHAGQIDLFLHLGDIAYGDGTFNQFHERFFVPYRDLMHGVTTWPTIGNHEMGTHDGQPYLDVFYLPEQALRDTEQERYYSFDWGNAHFVSLDSNSERLVPIIFDIRGELTDDMLDWARADLEAADADWKIGFFHHVPYSSSAAGINREVTGTIVPLLEETGVDLVLAGHDHHYERVVPLLDGCTAPGTDTRAITYLTNGAGGAGLRPAGGDWFTAFVESDVHSFLLLELFGCVLHGRAIDIDGAVIDEFDVYGCD